tara:strand:+ start:1357 stop:2511 length:1155 start_codon:yes stop_codon:yes gene_type:complete
MSSKLKVLQVIPKLGYGGAEIGCYDLAHFLTENECDSFIITSGGELLKYINKKKVKVIKLPVNSKNPLLIFINSIIISLIILIFNISVVHARSRAPAWSCLLATKITKRKFVTTFHGTYSFNNKLKKFYNSVMVKSDLIIAGSNFIFSHISENYSEYLNQKKKRFLVIFRGINTDYFDPTKIKSSEEEKLIKQWNITRNKKIILLPGRLSSWKGQELFIEALNIVKQKIGSTFYAIILGSDEGRTVYKKKLLRLTEQYRLNNELRFIENCKIMPLAYKISNLVVSSSIEPEAFGRISVEAQAMEKPILASNLGGSKETILNNKTGILFDTSKPSILAEKIVEMLQLDELTLKLMGSEGRKNIIKKFNVEKMCLSTYTEYKKLIN